MLSVTGEYALRATIYLAQHEADWPIAAGRIAEQARIPAKYLSKILGDLVRAGVLTSARGLGGGFRMQHPAKKTRLSDVLAPFGPIEHNRCPFGNQECREADPCLAHDQWKKVMETQERFLKRTSVFDVALKKQKKARR